MAGWQEQWELQTVSVVEEKVAQHTVRPVGSVAIWHRHLNSISLLGLLVLLLVAGRIISPSFLSAENLKVIILAVVGTSIIAFGMTMVVISGEIDLSVAGVAVLSSVVGAMFLETGSAVIVVSVTLLVGLLLGFLNGLLVVAIGIPSLIATLAMLGVARALANITSSGKAFYPDDIEGYLWLGRGDVLGVPVPILILVATALLSIVLTQFTVFGRKLYATGGNVSAARLSGIRTWRVKIAVFTICGIAAALGGILESARLSYINPAAFPGMELRVLAVTVLGGAALAGGSGTIVGTVLASMIIGVINSLLNQMGVSIYLQQVVTALIILAVVLPGLRQRLVAK